jgi:hypothetical protein
VASPLDVCALLPTTALSSILEGELAFGKSAPAGGWAVGQCTWSGPKSSFIARVGTAASVAAFGNVGTPDAAAMVEAFKENSSQAGSLREVGGVGDAAILGPNGMAAASEGTYVEITRLRLTDEQLIEITRLAVSNLERG